MYHLILLVILLSLLITPNILAQEEPVEEIIIPEESQVPSEPGDQTPPPADEGVSQDTPPPEPEVSPAAEGESSYFDPLPEENEQPILPADGSGTESEIQTGDGGGESSPQRAEEEIAQAEQKRPNTATRVSFLLTNPDLPEEERGEVAKSLADRYGIDPQDPEVISKVAAKVSEDEDSGLSIIPDGYTVVEGNLVKISEGSFYSILIGPDSLRVGKGIPEGSTDYEVGVVEGDDQERPFITLKPPEERSDQTISTTEYIQIAINQAYFRGGGVVMLPPGTYVLDKEVKLLNGVTLMGSGEGTVLKMGNNFPLKDNNALISSDSTDGTAQLTLRDLSIQGADFDPPDHNKGCTLQSGEVCTHGIKISGASGVVIDNVKISNFSYDGIYVGDRKNSATATSGILISNVDASGNGRNGISIVDGQNIIVQNSKVNDNNRAINKGVGVAGINIEPEETNFTGDIRLINNTVSSNGNLGIQVIHEKSGTTDSIEAVSLCGNNTSNNKANDFVDTTGKAKVAKSGSEPACTAGNVPSRPRSTKTIASNSLLDKIFSLAYAAKKEDILKQAIKYELEVKGQQLQNYKRIFGKVDDLFLTRLISQNMLDQKIVETNKGYRLFTNRSGIFEGSLPSSFYKVSVKPITGYDLTFAQSVDLRSKQAILAIAAKPGLGRVSKLPSKDQPLSLLPVVLAQSYSNLKAFAYSDLNGNGQLDGGEDILPWSSIKIDLETTSSATGQKEQLIPFFKIHVQP